MTINEAIQHLDESIPRIRADGCEECAREHEQLREWLKELAALRAKQEAEKNEALTLEELKELDGQPVWAEEPDGYKHYSRWVLVSCFWKSLIYLLSWPGQVTLETFLANGGKIYRLPPEKEEEPNV